MLFFLTAKNFVGICFKPPFCFEVASMTKNKQLTFLGNNMLNVPNYGVM